MKKIIITASIISTFLYGTLFAEDTVKNARHAHKGMMEMTPEQRQNMAAVHEKMAACLRSDRPLSECRNEMMQTCHNMMGKEGCPMMGDMGGMMGEGTGHHKGDAKKQSESAE